MSVSPPEIEALQETVSSNPLDVIEIHQEDIHRQCRIIYRNGDVIEKTSEEVADDVKKLCILRELQFSSLFKRLTEWCKVNPDNLLMACCERSEDYSKAYFFAVQNSNAYCKEFSRSLTRLEIEVEDSEKFNLINLKVFELPEMDEDTMQKFVANYTSNT